MFFCLNKINHYSCSPFKTIILYHKKKTRSTNNLVIS
nr:MAG TPA: hypothetical protein [Caudoviricetes sp.]